MHAAPQSLLDVASRVDKRLEALLAVERDRWARVDADLVPPIDEIARLVLAGGKRLRPAFCFWGFIGAGGDPTDELVIDAGAADVGLRIGEGEVFLPGDVGEHAQGLGHHLGANVVSSKDGELKSGHHKGRTVANRDGEWQAASAAENQFAETSRPPPILSG